MTTPPPTPNSPENAPAAVPTTARARTRRIARHTTAMPSTTDPSLERLLEPLRRDPERSAVLLDVDGVLAPIVSQPDDAHMSETTRRPLIEVARVQDGRVRLRPPRLRRAGSSRSARSPTSATTAQGPASAVRSRPSSTASCRRGRAACRPSCATRTPRSSSACACGSRTGRRSRRCTWRGVPDEGGRRGGDPRGRQRAEASGYRTHWGLGARDPAARADRQGRGDRRAAARQRPRGGDVRRRRPDRRRRLPRAPRARRNGPAGTALRVGVRSDEGPAVLLQEADVMVDGTDGVRDLRALLA